MSPTFHEIKNKYFQDQPWASLSVYTSHSHTSQRHLHTDNPHLPSRWLCISQTAVWGRNTTTNIFTTSSNNHLIETFQDFSAREVILTSCAWRVNTVQILRGEQTQERRNVVFVFWVRTSMYKTHVRWLDASEIVQFPLSQSITSAGQLGQIQSKEGVHFNITVSWMIFFYLIWFYKYHLFYSALQPSSGMDSRSQGKLVVVPR